MPTVSSPRCENAHACNSKKHTEGTRERAERPELARTRSGRALLHAGILFGVA